MARVFVYGSLMAGFCNHHVMQGLAPVRRCQTAPHYDLVEMDGYPALRNGARAIEGEEYEVSAELLAELDRFEGTPDWYVRGAVELETGEWVEGYYGHPQRVAGLPSAGVGRWPHRVRLPIT